MLRTILIVALRIGLLIVVGLALVLYFMQDSMIYFAREYQESELDVFKKRGGEFVEFTTSEGSQTAFFLPPSGEIAEPEQVWIVSGGNGARALDYVDIVQDWNPKWGFLFIDFPNYGLCDGNPSPATIRENTSGAVETLADRLGWKREKIEARFNAFGHSIGSAAVLQAAADFKMKRAVVVAPFTSMMEMAKATTGAPFCYVLRHRFDNRKSLEILRENKSNVFIFHGSEDSIIPVKMSETLATEFPDIVSFERIEGGDHNQIVGNIKMKLKAAANP